MRFLFAKDDTIGHHSTCEFEEHLKLVHADEGSTGASRHGQ
jgi:hypothetical protein